MPRVALPVVPGVAGLSGLCSKVSPVVLATGEKRPYSREVTPKLPRAVIKVSGLTAGGGGGREDCVLTEDSRVGG